MKIPVLFGTETGNAEMVADDVAEVLCDAGFEAAVCDMADFDVDELADLQLVVVISSTYGEGDLPDSAQPFYDALEQAQPDLSGTRFCVFGLGDSAYDTYNAGSRTLAEALERLGASRIGEHGLHDASSGRPANDAGRQWAAETTAALASVRAA